ncbi:20495_t:CDS:2 [Entrophospora sp. SA101]|nr:20495_t:CDS:2 [Entrophospora sp. SA101]
MNTRISRAIKASNELITNLHRDGLDRGCIATFNDSLVIRQDVAEEDENSVLLLSLSEPDNFNNGNEENFNNGIEENLNISSMFNLEPIVI